ncbi:GNAT family N-acetyltransferase [Robbsia andropogonis]|uniref:GNAT family N-acetyltransferase n=1 Tax=Robbsia andropogonis TaxID=28092 RepID=UPI002A6ABCD3|nr:N-acetyltransferase [Robbsia andropogonis]
MSTEWTFRLAKPDDTDAIVALMQSAYRGESGKQGWTTESDLLDGQRTDAAEVLETITNADSVVIVAFASTPTGPRLVATCNTARDAVASAAYFGAFAVAPDLQARGLGKRMLEQAEKHARQAWGVDTMRLCVLHTREELIAFYRRRGYVPTGETGPFPYGQPRFGIPKVQGLMFLWLSKTLP